MMRENFDEEKEQLLKIAQKEIKTNIPLNKNQIAQLKKLLAFLVLRAAKNETISTKNLRKLVNKLYKKTLIAILNDEEFVDLESNLEINMNQIIANEQMINPKLISKKLSPFSIFAMMKKIIMSLSAQQIIKKLSELRNQKANHRETPEEMRQRQRQREKVMLRTHERQRTR